MCVTTGIMAQNQRTHIHTVRLYAYIILVLVLYPDLVMRLVADNNDVDSEQCGAVCTNNKTVRVS